MLLPFFLELEALTFLSHRSKKLFGKKQEPHVTLEEGIVTAQNVRKTQLEFTAISEHCAGSGSGTSLVKQAIAPVETSEISSTLLCEEKNKTGHCSLDPLASDFSWDDQIAHFSRKQSTSYTIDIQGILHLMDNSG